MLNEKEKRIFLLGLLFVLVVYMGIKLIDNYQYFFDGIGIFISILKPIIFAILIAYLLNPLVTLIEKKLELRRGYATGLTFILIVGILFLAMWLIVPNILLSATQMLNSIPVIVKEMMDYLSTLELNNIQISNEVMDSIVNSLKGILPTIGTMIQTTLENIVSTTFAAALVAFNTFITIILSFYILVEKDKLIEYVYKITYLILGEKRTKGLTNLLSVLHSNLGKYLIGKGMDSVLVAVLAYLALTLIGNDYALLFALFFGVSNMIPYIGPLSSTIIISGITLFSGINEFALTLISLFTIQQIESFVIEPRVVGKQIGISPFLTLVSILIGGQLFGIIGMILAVPVMGIIKIYGVRFINKRFHSKEMVNTKPTTTEE